MSAKREHENENEDGSGSSDEECVGPSLSEAVETVKKKKRKGTYVSILIDHGSWVDDDFE